MSRSTFTKLLATKSQGYPLASIRHPLVRGKERVQETPAHQQIFQHCSNYFHSFPKVTSNGSRETASQTKPHQAHRKQ